MIWREICRYLKRYVPENSTVLDLGAGYGDLLKHLSARKKYGIEMNPLLVEEWGNEIEALVQSALDSFPLADGFINVVFASNFFEHFVIEDCQKILGEVRRVLDASGRLIVIQPNMRLQLGRYFDDYTHKTPFTEISFSDFLESLGWGILRREARFLPFTLLRRKPRVFRPWMNAGRVPFEAPKERSRVCFGGVRPTKHVEEPRALARGAPQ